jgi:hypothetical protein
VGKSRFGIVYGPTIGYGMMIKILSSVIIIIIIIIIIIKIATASKIWKLFKIYLILKKFVCVYFLVGYKYKSFVLSNSTFNKQSCFQKEST